MAATSKSCEPEASTAHHADYFVLPRRTLTNWPIRISNVTFLRQRRRTLIVMAVFALVCALATATLIGYYFGRRAGSSRSSWKKRTSRIALGRLAMSLLVLMTARRVRHGFRAERVLGVWRLRTIAPLDVLRGGVARMRSY